MRGRVAGSELRAVLRSAACTAAIAALGAWPARAAAQESMRPSYRLEWHAPAGCPNSAEAREAIDAALGTKLPPSARPAVVRVQIAQQADGRWNADIWMYGAAGSGERSFAGASCAHVTEATALIVAMALDPEGAGARGEPARATPAPASGPGLRFSIGVHALGDAGSLPDPTVGAGLALGVEFDRLRLQVEGAALWPQVARIAGDDELGGRFGLFTGALRGCYDAARLLQSSVGLGPCLAAELGVATAAGVGISDPYHREDLWAAGLLGLSIRHGHTSPLRLGLLVEVGVPLRRPIWEIPDFADVFQASAVLGRLSLGAAWLFP